MTLFCSLFYIFIMWTVDACADEDPVLLNVLGELSELKAMVQRQNAEIAILKQTVQKQGQELLLLSASGPKNREWDRGRQVLVPNESNGIGLALSQQKNTFSFRESDEKNWTRSEDIAFDSVKSRKKRFGENIVHPVGFTAYRYADNPLVPKQTIIFETVYSNVGFRYSHLTGVFTADISGLYVFYFGLECGPHQSLAAEVMNNGAAIGLTYCDSKSDAYSNSGEMIVTEVTSGASIWVRVVSSSNPGADVLGHKTMFSGFLAFESF